MLRIRRSTGKLEQCWMTDTGERKWLEVPVVDDVPSVPTAGRVGGADRHSEKPGDAATAGGSQAEAAADHGLAGIFSEEACTGIEPLE